MSGQQLSYLALNLALYDNLALLSRAVARYPDPAEALAAPVPELRALGFEEDRARRLGSRGLLEAAEKEFDRLGENGYSLVTLGDVDYPFLLREIFDPPCVLYCHGRREALGGPAVAVVGSRTPTPYGRAVAERLAEDLASRGVVVVSGLALGVDSAAHWGALRGGRTVAVLGSGLNMVYPKEHEKLSARVAESGAVVSEFPLDTSPLAQNFPRRNRVISGLSLGLVVVEAAERSGSLISAGLALEHGREVMAVPGNITSGRSRGTNALIKDGAKLVEGWEDVAQEMPEPLRSGLLAQRPGETPPLPLLTDAEEAVWKTLKPDVPTPLDALLEESAMSVSELLAVLLSLEIKGAVVQHPGKAYRRRM
ncbi:MAG: DNA-protecting protein DprA [Candidatus Aminicenantes bacterium]|nr:DNA-protecting protein DprA [Candidatus Aminicenantes bacterium]